MSPPKKKKTEWRQCESCGCILLARDFQHHSIHWDPKNTDAQMLNNLKTNSVVPHGFYIFKRFFTSVISMSPEMENELSRLPMKYIKRVVLLHPSEKKKFDMMTSDEVVLQNSSGHQIVSFIWPSKYVSFGHIALGNELFKRLSVTPNEWVVLTPYTVQKLPATVVVLKPGDDCVIEDIEAFECYLRLNQDECLYTEGNKLFANFLGTELELQITKITTNGSLNDRSLPINETDWSCSNLEAPSFNASSLSDSFQNLKIKETSNHNNSIQYESLDGTVGGGNEPEFWCSQFYFITDRTNFVIIGFEKSETQEKRLYNSNISFDTIGGLVEEKRKMKSLICMKLNPNIENDLENFTGILLYGLQGTGKTLLVEAIAKSNLFHFISVWPSDVLGKSGEACKFLSELFAEARLKSPSIIFLKNLELLCPKSNSPCCDVEVTIVKRQLISLLEKLSVSKGKVIVIGETNKIDEIDTDLRREGRFDEEIEFTIPTQDERKEIITMTLRDVTLSLIKYDLVSLAKQTQGFVGSDLEAMCSFAKLNSATRLGVCSDSLLTITDEDLTLALKKVTPSGMRGMELTVPEVLWDDIAIKEETKITLEQIIVLPVKYPELYESYLLERLLNRNVLLYGPPGCSKTLIAKALATESGLNFIAVKSSELISKYYGDSEHAINNLFERARLAAPSIIFFDEFDGLAMKNVNVGAEVDIASLKIRSQLAIELDKLKPSCCVSILAATNRPDLIDDAFLSRLETKIYIPLPDISIRSKIFEITFRKMPIDTDVKVDELVANTAKFSGAEVVQLCHNAAKAALKANGDNLGNVKMEHFCAAMSLVKPKISDALIKHNERYFQNIKKQSFLSYL